MAMFTLAKTTSSAPSISTSRPSLPPGDVYELALKRVLRQRYTYTLLPTSAVLCWTLASLWTCWLKGGLEELGVFGLLSNTISPPAIFCAAIWWSFGSIPIAVLRKYYMYEKHTPLASPQQAFVHNSKKTRYGHVLLVYVSSAVVLNLSYSVLSYATESHQHSRKFWFWAGSVKHPYHLNGQFVFVLLSQLCSVVVFWVSNLLKDRYSMQWSRYSTLRSQLLASIASSFIAACLLSCLAVALSGGTLVYFRSIILPLIYRIPIVHEVLRPFLAHFLRRRYTLTFLWTHQEVVTRAYVATFSDLLIWEMTEAIFDACFSCPVVIQDRSKDTAVALVSGIYSSNPYFQLCAFHELCSLSSESELAKNQRAVIYADVKNRTTLWTAIVRQCLVLLGADYQLLIRRGRHATASAPATASNIIPKVHETTTPIIRKPVFKTTQPTSVTTFTAILSSDNTDLIPPASESDYGRAPQKIFDLSSSHSFAVHLPAGLAKTKNAMLHALTSIAASMTRSLPRGPMRSTFTRLVVWWRRERKDKVACMALPNRELDSMIVEVLSTLTSHSLHEDEFGLVQRDVARILEALILFLLALESYQLEMMQLREQAHQQISIDANEAITTESEASLALEQIDELINILHIGIGLIKRTFDDRLASFKFPVKIATKLQEFVDYT